jgi:FkbM family methyltransferase
MSLFKSISFLLPHLAVETLRRRKELQSIGMHPTWQDCLKYGKILTSLRICNLDLLPPGQIRTLKHVVDVGANTGLWSTHLLKSHIPETLTIFEPIPHICDALKKNMAHFPFADIRCIVAGDRLGTIPLHVTVDTTGASVLSPDAEMNRIVDNNWNITEVIDCPMDTLDNQLSHLPVIDLLKIDVQGFEFQVLKGSEQTLKRTRFVFIEWNFIKQYENGSHFTDIFNLLTETHGFVLSNLSKPLIIKDKAIYADALFINPSFHSIG